MSFSLGLIRKLLISTLGRNIEIVYDCTQDINNPFGFERDIICCTKITNKEKEKLINMKYNKFPAIYKINLIFNNEVV